MRALTLLLVVFAYAAPAPVYDWIQTSPSHPQIDLKAVVWSGTEWLALGPEGKLLTSVNSVDWTYRVSGMSGSPDILIPAGGWLAALGDAGAVYTTSDARSWTSRNTGASYKFTAGAWNGSLMVLIGPSGTLATSKDGKAWNLIKLPTTQNLSCVAWAGDRWVIVAPGGLGYTSADGATWTLSLSDQFSNPSFLVWNGKYLVMNDYDLVTSADGKTWIRDPRVDMNGLQKPVWAGTHLIAIHSNGPKTTFARSTEGNAWEDFPGPDVFSAFGWSGGLLITVGGSGQIFTSRNEADWASLLKFPTRKNLASVAASDSMLVAVGDVGTLVSSSDGLNWTARDSRTNNHFVKVIWVSGKFYAFDRYGVIVASSNGIDWQDESPANRVPILDLVWAGDRFLAPTGQGMRTSFDGKTWTDQDTGFSGFKITAAAWNGKRYFAGGAQFFTSSDATHWKRIEGSDDPYPAPLSMACNSNQCVALGRGDNTIWSIRQSGDAFVLKSLLGSNCSQVIAKGSGFIAICDATIRVSRDGEEWESYPIREMTSAVPFRDSIFLVGLRGLMYVSKDPGSGIGIRARTIAATPVLRILPGSVRLETGFELGPGTRAALFTLTGNRAESAVARFEGTAVEFATGGLAAGIYRIEVMHDGKRLGRIFCHPR